MHEQSMMKALVRQVDALARQHQGCRVRTVVIRRGALGHGTTEHLEEHFRRAAQGTVAESARLEVAQVEDLIDLALESVEVELLET